ncbi:hypothetical protein B0H13DRAFT_2370830 [Mycena leptocephala]|nr:hypothetical protein B0H13DRAFT_2370830 [Mycena leptocephala]
MKATPPGRLSLAGARRHRSPPHSASAASGIVAYNLYQPQTPSIDIVNHLQPPTVNALAPASTTEPLPTSQSLFCLPRYSLRHRTPRGYNALPGYVKRPSSSSHTLFSSPPCPLFSIDADRR